MLNPVKDGQQNTTKKRLKVVLLGLSLPIDFSSQFGKQSQTNQTQPYYSSWRQSLQLKNNENPLNNVQKIINFLQNIPNYRIIEVRDSVDQEYLHTQENIQKKNYKTVDIELAILCDDTQRRNIIDKLPKLRDKSQNEVEDKHKQDSLSNNPFFCLQQIKNIEQFIYEYEPSFERNNLNSNTQDNSTIANILDQQKSYKSENRAYLLSQTKDNFSMKFIQVGGKTFQTELDEQQDNQKIEIEKYVKYILIFLCVTACLCVAFAMIPMFIHENQKNIISSKPNIELSSRGQLKEKERQQDQTKVVGKDIQNSNFIPIKLQVDSIKRKNDQQIDHSALNIMRSSIKARDQKHDKQKE